MSQPNGVALGIVLVVSRSSSSRASSRWRPFAATPTTASTAILISLLAALIPTTIGALLSAIGIARMDRLVRREVFALSGRAVEASGDVDVPLLDETGTITLGNSQAAASSRCPA